MTDKTKVVLKYILSAVLILITLVLVWMTNHEIPFMMDDLWYSTKLANDEPINNASDILQAQIWHYNNWGGRAMTHTLLQFILLCGEKIADILNTLMVLVTGILLTKISETVSGIKFKLSSKLIVIALMMGAIHGFSANWELSMYWQSGAANYLYITIFILLFLWCYIREISAAKPSEIKVLPGIYIWIVPLAVLSGWSNENMGPVSFLFSVAAIIYVYKKSHKIKIWMLEGAICSLAGSVFCILAPGNFVRSDTIESNNYGIIWQIYLHCYSVFNGLFIYLFLLVFSVILLYVVSYGILRIKPSFAEIFLLLAALLSWGAMIISPHYPDRASYGTMILLIVAGLANIQRITLEKPKAIWGMYAYGGMIWLRGMFFLADYLGVAWGWIK